MKEGVVAAGNNKVELQVEADNMLLADGVNSIYRAVVHMFAVHRAAVHMVAVKYFAQELIISKSR